MLNAAAALPQCSVTRSVSDYGDGTVFVHFPGLIRLRAPHL